MLGQLAPAGTAVLTSCSCREVQVRHGDPHSISQAWGLAGREYEGLREVGAGRPWVGGQPGPGCSSLRVTTCLSAATGMFFGSAPSPHGRNFSSHDTLEPGCNPSLRCLVSQCW